VRELTQLRSLVFTMTNVSEVELEALEKAMPATHISGDRKRIR
jgi:hypothetical protein